MYIRIKWRKLSDYGTTILCIVFVCAFLLGGCFIVYDSYKQTYDLNYKYRYSVGKVVDHYRSGHLVKKIKYRYTVHKKVYERSEIYQGGEVGKRYFIKFSIETPRYADLLADKPLPDSIKVIPPEGWKEIPE